MLVLLAALASGCAKEAKDPAEATSGACGDSVEALIGEIRYASVQAAVDDAPDSGVVTVCAGTHHENLTITNSVNLVGDLRATTTIDGSRSGAVISSTSQSLVLQDLTLQGGTGYVWSPPEVSGLQTGGGIYWQGENLVLERVTLQENTSVLGSALYALGRAGGATAVVVSDSHVLDNLGVEGADSANSGALLLDGPFSLTANNSEFSGNVEGDVAWFTAGTDTLVRQFVPTDTPWFECDSVHDDCTFSE